MTDIHQKRLKVLTPFIKELSDLFNRTQEDILANGLFATDFNGNVRLVYEDGSYIHYQGAFLIKNSKQVGVFTEHCGYHLHDITDFDDYVEDAPYAPVFPR